MKEIEIVGTMKEGKYERGMTQCAQCCGITRDVIHATDRIVVLRTHMIKQIGTESMLCSLTMESWMMCTRTREK